MMENYLLIILTMTVHVTWNLPMLKITIGAEFTKVSTAKVSTASSLSPKWGVVWGTGVHVSSFNSSIQPVTCQTIWEVWQSFLTTRTFFHFIKIQLSSTFQFYKNIFHPEFQFCIISLHCREKKYRLFYFFLFVCLHNFTKTGNILTLLLVTICCKLIFSEKNGNVEHVTHV